MKKIWKFLIDPERPRVLTIIGIIFLIFTIIGVLNLIVTSITYHSTISVAAILSSAIRIALIYFLLAGKNWARLFIGFSCAISGLIICISFFNNHFSWGGIVGLMYAIVVFVLLMLNKNILGYFKRGSSRSSEPT